MEHKTLHPQSVNSLSRGIITAGKSSTHGGTQSPYLDSASCFVIILWKSLHFWFLSMLHLSTTTILSLPPPVNMKLHTIHTGNPYNYILTNPSIMKITNSRTDLKSLNTYTKSSHLPLG